MAVDPGGPAAAAGLRSGDVVISLGGREIQSLEDLLGALRDAEPGQQLPITIAPGQAEITAQVTLGAVPA